MFGINSPDYKFYYLIPDNADGDSGMNVTTVGFQRIANNTDYPSKKHPDGYVFDVSMGRYLHEYQLIYITDGEGFYKDESGTQAIRKGDLILLRPGRWHTYCPKKQTGWTEYYIGFTGKTCDQLFGSLFSDDTPTVRIGMNDELVQLYQSALNAAGPDYYKPQLLLCGIAMHMLGLINNIISSDALDNDRFFEIVNKAKIYMHEHITQRIDLPALALEYNMSYSWFRKVFRDYTGYPPAKYQQIIKLRYAQQLLTNSSQPIKEIAYFLGFKSIEHFHSLFHKQTGMTPNEYRIGGENKRSNSKTRKKSNRLNS